MYSGNKKARRALYKNRVKTHKDKSTGWQANVDKSPSPTQPEELHVSNGVALTASRTFTLDKNILGNIYASQRYPTYYVGC
jgi:hypothetical protein